MVQPLILLLSLLALSCRAVPRAEIAQAMPPPARYLYVWAGDHDERDSDFLAVIDVQRGSRTYGEIIATEPVGMGGTMPHHMEYTLPEPGELLFANGHHHEQIFLFQTDSAPRPRFAGTAGPAAPLRYPHDFIRLPNGNVLVGYLRSEGPSPSPGDTTRPGGHGGVAEFTGRGRLVRIGSAAVPGDSMPVRTYAFALFPEQDRFLSTSASMMEPLSANVVQIWRLSDLKVLQTLQVPPARAQDGSELPMAHDLPFEPRVMSDNSVLLNAYGCGMYRVTGVQTAAAQIQHVYTVDVPVQKLGSCGVPVVAGQFWVMPVGKANLVVTLDIRDPSRPVEVSRLAADSTFRPHWLAKDPGSDRIIVGAENGGENRMLMALIDPATGRLSWDESFRSDPGAIGVSFRRELWPHGRTGEAFAHAALFRR